MDRIIFLPDKAIKGFDPAFNINHFFFEQDCFLKLFYVFGEDGRELAGNYIEKWCRATDINPRIIAVTLEREQGLINYHQDPTPEQRIYRKTVKDEQGKDVEIDMDIIDWACGCGVPDQVLPNPKYKGFEKQIRGACYTYANWFSQFKVNTIYKLYGNEGEIIPENAATYSLLQYTPHMQAGRDTAAYYKKYFGDYLNAILL